MLMLRSFLGHLEGTEKSANTIKNYQIDLRVLERYLKSSSLAVDELDTSTLRGFSAFLSVEGYKKNSQRRILLTAQKFLRYALKRKKISPESAPKVPTPHKVERIPRLLDLDQVRKAALKDNGGEPTEIRNRVLVLILAETGCLVSEVASFRFRDLERRSPNFVLQLVHQKRNQSFVISQELGNGILRLATQSRGLDAPICDAHQRFGSLGAPISPRGVEWVLKHLAIKWEIPGLTARALRQSRAVEWLKQGKSEAEVQELLGLSSDYAFRTYRLLVPDPLKSTTSAKSTRHRSSARP